MKVNSDLEKFEYSSLEHMMMLRGFDFVKMLECFDFVKVQESLTLVKDPNYSLERYFLDGKD